MKLLIHTLAAGPKGVLVPGTTVELADADAAPLIAAGAATAVATVPPPTQAVTVPIERATATEPTTVERATAPAAARKKARR